MSDYLCISLLGSGSQTPVNSVAECSAIDPAAFVATSVTKLASDTGPTLQDIFSIPASADLQTMWELGFELPVLCYLVAWAYGTVIEFMDSRKTH